MKNKFFIVIVILAVIISSVAIFVTLPEKLDYTEAAVVGHISGAKGGYIFVIDSPALLKGLGVYVSLYLERNSTYERWRSDNTTLEAQVFYVMATKRLCEGLRPKFSGPIVPQMYTPYCKVGFPKITEIVDIKEYKVQ
ncbi:TPA: hypothetical protein H1016_01190 [archaeon]|uniref:Uncharacterized protein n=1 Tax=Candidatus Naiadarchaeum limnaeum TaxID=2756139 RepID=A0A832UR53_9ARCH|nr:hypothetical protein [Candidatus Naiadarchaeum limnaeum]